MSPDDEFRITVRLTPRAGADRIDGVVDGALRCRVAAAPVEGAANGALVRLLARELGLSRTEVRLVSGEGSRRKIVAIPAASRTVVASRWPGLID
jgi:uncharacterized protein YggU (UPF0235/DUF167 family)